MKTVDHNDFREAALNAINKTYTDSRGKERLYSEQIYLQEDYSGCVCILSEDKKSGAAVTGSGELVSVFSYGRKGQASEVVRLAIDHGANHLNCYDEDGFLPNFYRNFGFEETARESWNPEYAPEVWGGGTPDVVWMKR